jgi:PadR family transcriptional regulator PadR
MKGTHLGEFEELVLLTTAVINGNAYTVSIVEEIQSKTGRQLTLSSVHTVLSRLANKGFVRSEMGGPTNERGGRRRRLYTITSAGYQTLNDAKEIRSEMWAQMPNLSFDFSY